MGPPLLSSALFDILLLPHCYPCQVSAKFDTCTVVDLNGTLVEAKMFTFTLEYTHFTFNKGPI
jgi:hypothetical protein